jgi:7-cyano-7-deazaguanine synthase
MAFAEAFDGVAAEGTPTKPHIYAPLVELDKAKIIQLGTKLGAPLEVTWSCYDPLGDMHCARCDACKGRREGFAKAGIQDPTLYAEGGGE